MSAIPFEFFLFLSIICFILGFWGFTRGSVAAFLAGVAMAFFIALFIGSDGIIMLDGTLYTAANNTLLKLFSESVIMGSVGLIALTMVVAFFYSGD